MRYIILSLITVFIFSCTGKNDVPKGIMKPEKMQEVFWDYVRADVYTREYLLKDSNKDANIENLRLQEKIFTLHHTDRKTFYESFNYYSNHKELMSALIDSMVTKNQRVKATKKKADSSIKK